MRAAPVPKNDGLRNPKHPRRRLHDSEGPLPDLDSSDDDDAAAQKRPAPVEAPFSQPPALDPALAESMAFNCHNCGQRVGATRYAAHLEKCMGKGGRSCTREKRKSAGS